MTMDYTKFTASDQPASENQITKDGLARRWWTIIGEKQDDNKEIELTEETSKLLANAIAGVCNFLQAHQSARQAQMIRSMRLYGNQNVIGMNGISYSMLSSIQNAIKDRVTFNIVQSAIDTVTAKIQKNKPRPLFLTNRGDYRKQKKAEMLNQYVEGVFYENKAYEEGPFVFRDGAIVGDGLTHVYIDSEGRIKYERVLASELFVDEIEGMLSKPRQLHRVKSVDKYVLAECFPKKKDQIIATQDTTNLETLSHPNISDQITVRESFHLPSGKKATDGWKVISINGCTLDVRPWKKDYYPFARCPWSRRQVGYWSQGAAEQIQNTQLELNKLLQLKQRSIYMMASFKVLIKNTSKIVKEHINNEVGAMIVYSDTPPEYVTPPPYPPQLDQDIESKKKDGYELVGVSQMSANANKPAGLNSGKALREFSDIETDRFTTIYQSYESYYMELADLTVKESLEEFGKKSYKVTYPGKNFIETIDWKDIDLQRDEFSLKAYPVSSLPSDPAGRLQTVQEYVQAGFITPRAARRLLDTPDIDMVEALDLAPEEYLHKIFDEIIEDGIYTPPAAENDLALAKDLVMKYIHYAQLNNVPEDRVEMLRRFNVQLAGLDQIMNPPPPPGAPQANPQAPPVSDLVPNVPGAGAA